MCSYYDFNVMFPPMWTLHAGNQYTKSITNARHEDADFTLHENLERMILETGDEMRSLLMSKQI